MALTPGTRLGVYEITAQIGEGGMGQVYRATDTRLKRQVAIKILPPSMAEDADRLARFQREAEVLASLNHPHIAAIYGLEEADGVKALVMELVEGDDLSQRIARGAIPLDEAVPIAKQIADALEAAHEQGIIHRDLKPANAKVRPDGTVNTTNAATTLALADRAGVLARLAAPPGPYVHVRASRDGGRLAIGSDDGKEASVSIQALAGTSAMQRLTLVGQNRFPIWSPDGERVTFQSDREGDLAIFSQRADGSGAVERLTKPAQGEAHVPESWSKDGKLISFSVAKGPAFSLWTVTVADKKAAPFGAVQSAEPIGSVFSPDGRWIAYSSAPVSGPGGTRSPNRGVYVQPVPATGERYQIPKQQIDFHPVWGPKGTELFYVPTALTVQLAVVSFTTQPGVTFGSPATMPARVTGSRISSETRAWDILPDGRFVGVVPASEPDASAATVAPQFRVVLNWFEELKARVPAR